MFYQTISFSFLIALFLGGETAHALTFKSGETLSANNGPSVISPEDVANIDPLLLEAQMLLQRFGYVQTPPTGEWSSSYIKGLRLFYKENLDISNKGGWKPEVVEDLRARRLHSFPQQGGIDYATESYDISEFGFKTGFDEVLNKPRYRVGDFGFTAVYSDELTKPLCYPTPTDCNDTDTILSPNPHNAHYGDFNNDGHEDMAISWIYFNHTVPRKKTPSHLRIYLNDGNGKLVSSPEIYKDGIVPLRHFSYRINVDDFNNDGVDDIFAGSMGVIQRIKNQGMISDMEPHILLLSDGTGKLRDASHQIAGQELGGLAYKGGFAHTNSSGDVNCDGNSDIYAGGIMLINDGAGHFTNETHQLPPAVAARARSPQGASAIVDINQDGCGEIIMFNFAGEGYMWASTSGKNDQRKLSKININHSYGKGNMQVNHAASGDINGDGLPDVVAAIHRKNPYYEGRRLVLLLNENGKLVDRSVGRINDVRDQNNQPLLQAWGEGTIKLRDHDNDGDLDIIDTTSGSWSMNGRFGLTIFENDGAGHFTEIPQSEMVVVTESMIKGFFQNRETVHMGYPINLDNKGLLDYVSFVPTPALPDYSYAYIGFTVFGK